MRPLSGQRSAIVGPSFAPPVSRTAPPLLVPPDEQPRRGPRIATVEVAQSCCIPETVGLCGQKSTSPKGPCFSARPEVATTLSGTTKCRWSLRPEVNVAKGSLFFRPTRGGNHFIRNHQMPLVSAARSQRRQRVPVFPPDQRWQPLYPEPPNAVGLCGQKSTSPKGPCFSARPEVATTLSG